LRQAGLTCSSKFCYLYSVWCRGQDAVPNSRPIANIYVVGKAVGHEKHNGLDLQDIVIKITDGKNRTNKTMDTIDKEVLRKNRRTALILGVGTTLILQIIIYTILKTISNQKEQLIALAISTLLLVIFIIIIGKYRKSAKKLPPLTKC
jgi:hypothetical protein